MSTHNKLTKLNKACLLVLPLMFSCGVKNKFSQDKKNHGHSITYESSPPFKASSNIVDSFHVSHEEKKRNRSKIHSDSFVKNKDRLEHSAVPVGIKESALDKEFLIRANIIEGGLAPSFHNLKSRIAAFTLKNGQLYLMEAVKGHAYYSDLPQQLILAKFSIDKTENGIIYFDFNRGMSKLYTMEDWYAQDFSGADHASYGDHFDGVYLQDSYLDKVYLHKKKDYLYIQQIAQMSMHGDTKPVEVRYMIEPYRPNQTFKPSVSSRFKKEVGFFEVNPTISEDTGKAVTHASKFDISKPVTFAISANTPEEYRSAIREGVLYWNKAFGRDVLNVINAPEGHTAPSYKYNMIQWIDWEDASSAYADAQMDPRTGEILNAQIYLSSVFAVSGKNQARKVVRSQLSQIDFDHVETESSAKKSMKSWLKRLAEDQKLAASEIRDSLLNTKKITKKVSLSGFGQNALCNHSHMESLVQSMAELLHANVDEDTYMKVSQDHVRDVLAHELGHVLGLRHNFAGSKAGNVSWQDRKQVFANYLETKKTPEGVKLSSSVMDYMPFKESVMIGNQLKNNTSALPYDDLAINVLYKDLDIRAVENAPLFCTDSHLRKYIDCNVWDVGESPVAYSKWQTAENIENFPKYLAEYFINNAKSVPEGEEELPYNQILIKTFPQALRLLEPRMRALSGLSSNSRALWLDRQYQYVTESNMEDIDKAFAEWMHQDLQTHGEGKWENIFDHIPENFAEDVSRKFAALIESDAYIKGVGPGGAYEFSSQEIEQMKGAVEKFMKEMEVSLEEADLLQIFSVGEVSQTKIGVSQRELGQDVAEYFKKKAGELIFSYKKDRTEGVKDIFHSSSLKLKAEADLVAKNEEDLAKKLVVLQMVIESGEKLTFEFNDNDPSKSYTKEEYNEIASLFLNKLLEEVMEQEELVALFSNLDLNSVLSGFASQQNNTQGDKSDLTGSGDMELDDLDLSEDMDLSDFLNLKSKLGTDISKLSSYNRLNVEKAGILFGMDKESESLAADLSTLYNSVDKSSKPEEGAPNQGGLKLELKIPVSLKLPIVLPEYKHHYQVRVLAAKLLNSERGASLAFAMKRRVELSNEFSEEMDKYLRKEKIAKKDLSSQSKMLNVWYQENNMVKQSLEETSILSLLFGGM